MKKTICRMALVVGFFAAAAYVLTSCNVTRTVSTTSQTYTRGDTCVMIQTKTVESYDATKKTNL